MIISFPSLYPDELLYSLFARYYAQSGHIAYVFAAEELFANRATKPDIEFMDALTVDAKRLVMGERTVEDVIEKHTMFPYYVRFLDRRRRRQAMALIKQTDERYHNFLYQNRGKRAARYLRSCPLCAAKDRELFGETYWHRSHQLYGIDICPIHKCFLHNSTVAISSKGSPSLECAEILVPKSVRTILCKDELMKSVAEYVHSVFLRPVDMNTDIPVGRFLHSKLEYTKYLSPRGEQRNLTRLFADYAAYYSLLPNQSLDQSWKLEKVFCSDRLSSFEICLVAMFLGVSPGELTRMTLPSISQPEWFDNKIRILHVQGMKYPEIARQMGASYDFVKLIGSRGKGG